MHAPPRRRQEERSEATQARILTAAIECLSKLGYPATTTVAVGERAGVSRGALLHHFPTRAELIAAAIRRLFEELDERFRKAFAQIPADADRIDAVVDLIWKGYATPKVPPLLELFVAARTDARFRSALAPVAREHRNRLRELVVESLVD
ncbi:MAG: TetR/AcrR family transcriptional regulator, partial [bacterium]|nr:TetR/AcrR family transcriptional regulator [bacterium]